jgi:nucleoside-diphosphate-sugar epimerase
MRVLVTGGLGNVGRSCLTKLLEQGHRVRCLDLKTKHSQRSARTLEGRVDVLWGDLRRQDDVAAAVQDQEAVVHLAFVLPPASEDRPEWAHEVNVGGTRNLLQALKGLRPPPLIVFASSFSVFGETQHLPPPRTVSDPVQPMDNYNRHKVECERLVRDSGLDWSILRLGVVPPSTLGGFSPKMFDIPPGSRVEFAHPRDVGLALANAVVCPLARGRVLLVGGGPGSQLRYRDFVGRMTESLGVGRLPDSAFAPSASAYTDWLDTAESQKLLQYQQHSFEDFVREVAASLGYRRRLMRLFAPLIRRWMLSQSPHYRASRLAAPT